MQTYDLVIIGSGIYGLYISNLEVFKDKKVLILDETTNGIDILSEENIVRKVKEEYDVTLILISHRYDNLKLFNKVFEIKGGTKCERIK